MSQRYTCLLVEWDDGESLFVPKLSPGLRFVDVMRAKQDTVSKRSVGEITGWLKSNRIATSRAFKSDVEGLTYSLAAVEANKAQATLVAMFFDVTMVPQAAIHF